MRDVRKHPGVGRSDVVAVLSTAAAGEV